MENGLTGRERFSAALRREKIIGHVPQFELVFFLTMEVLGKVHPSHRYYEQWNQMSKTEQSLQINDMADIYIDIAKKYHHDAIFVHPNPSDIDNTKWLLETIREKSGNEFFLLMHGDTTCSIPDGDHMMEFSCQMYEEPEKIHEQQNQWFERSMKVAQKLSGTGLLDGFALCSDYSFNVNPFFSPDSFEELIVPHLKETIKEYRNMGYYVIKHSDGNLNPILGQIVDCNPHAIHSVDPQGSMVMSDVKAKYGDKVCFIGNVNCGLLQTGSLQEAADDVRRSLREGMDEKTGNGYIFSTSNCVYTGLDLSRYELMEDIWLKDGIYK